MKWTESTGGGTFENVPDDTYPARLIRLIDWGTQREEYQGEVSHKRKVMLVFELPTELIEDGDYAGMPRTVSKIYTQSLHDKSNLRRDLATWLQDRYEGWAAKDDPTLLLGISAYVTTVGGRIKAVTKPAKGSTVPKQIHPSVYFSLDPDSFDATVFGSLSQRLQQRIAQSPEYAARMSGASDDLPPF